MSNFARFHTLLKQLPHADKELLVETYSDGMTASLREFLKSNPSGFNKMITEMQNLVESKPKKSAVSEDEPQKRRFRSLILRAMQDQGVVVKNGDWSAVNEFVVRYAGAGKSLSNMSLEELKKFNAQVHSILDWHKKKREALMRAAIQN